MLWALGICWILNGGKAAHSVRRAVGAANSCSPHPFADAAIPLAVKRQMLLVVCCFVVVPPDGDAGDVAVDHEPGGCRHAATAAEGETAAGATGTHEFMSVMTNTGGMRVHRHSLVDHSR
jgi:hypothetical protein